MLADVDIVDRLRVIIPRQRRPVGFASLLTLLRREVATAEKWNLQPALVYMLRRGEIVHDRNSGYSQAPHHPKQVSLFGGTHVNNH
jgi:hypothetical protein